MPRLRAAHYEALFDFLAEAVAVEGPAPFPEHVLESMRRVVESDAISYREWNAERVLESAVAADDLEACAQVWSAYARFRREDPLPGGPSGRKDPHPLPASAWLGRPLTISDVASERDFRNSGLYAEICRPLGVRTVMKLFLPTNGAIGAAFVFDTTRQRFAEYERLALARLLPQLIQLRRNAHARQVYVALSDDTSRAEGKLLRRLTAREQVVLSRAAAGETNPEIARALFVSLGTVRKHLEHIYDKLEVRNRTAATAIYARTFPPAGLASNQKGSDPEGV